MVIVVDDDEQLAEPLVDIDTDQLAGQLLVTVALYKRFLVYWGIIPVDGIESYDTT